MSIMKCPECNGNAVQTSLGNMQLGFKCLNSACKYEFVIKGISDKDKEQSEKNKFIERARAIKNTDKHKILVSNIKKIRLNKKIGQNEFSEFLNVSAQRYGAIERCENTPVATMLSDLQELYDVSWDELYTTVYISKDQYELLSQYVEKSDNINEITIEPTIGEYKKKLTDKEEEFGITERRVYEHTKIPDSAEVKQQKEILQGLYKEYTDYLKKSKAILKRDRIIDFYHYELLKGIEEFKDLP